MLYELGCLCGKQARSPVRCSILFSLKGHGCNLKGPLSWSACLTIVTPADKASCIGKCILSAGHLLLNLGLAQGQSACGAYAQFRRLEQQHFLRKRTTLHLVSFEQCMTAGVVSVQVVVTGAGGKTGGSVFRKLLAQPGKYQAVAVVRSEQVTLLLTSSACLPRLVRASGAVHMIDLKPCMETLSFPISEQQLLIGH